MFKNFFNAFKKLFFAIRDFLKEHLMSILVLIPFILCILGMSLSLFNCNSDEKIAYADNADDVYITDYSQIYGIIAVSPNGRIILDNSSEFEYSRYIVSDYDSPILYFRSPVLVLERGANEFIITCPQDIDTIFISYTAIDGYGNIRSNYTSYQIAVDLYPFSYVEENITTDFYILKELIISYDVGAVGSYPFTIEYYNNSGYTYSEFTVLSSSFLSSLTEHITTTSYNNGYNAGIDGYVFNNPFKAITEFFERMVEVPLIGWLTIGDLVLVAIMIPLTILICKLWFGG